MILRKADSFYTSPSVQDAAASQLLISAPEEY